MTHATTLGRRRSVIQTAASILETVVDVGISTAAVFGYRINIIYWPMPRTRDFFPLQIGMIIAESFVLFFVFLFVLLLLFVSATGAFDLALGPTARTVGARSYDVCICFNGLQRGPRRARCQQAAAPDAFTIPLLLHIFRHTYQCISTWCGRWIYEMGVLGETSEFRKSNNGNGIKGEVRAEAVCVNGRHDAKPSMPRPDFSVLEESLFGGVDSDDHRHGVRIVGKARPCNSILGD